MSFKFLVSCPSLHRARQIRRVLAREFGIPITSLLAQFDVATDGKVPAILYCPQTHRTFEQKGQQDRTLNNLTFGEQEGWHQRLRDKVEPFLHGYCAGRRRGAR